MLSLSLLTGVVVIVVDGYEISCGIEAEKALGAEPSLASR